jgi:hypothetical protein
MEVGMIPYILNFSDSPVVIECETLPLCLQTASTIIDQNEYAVDYISYEGITVKNRDEIFEYWWKEWTIPWCDFKYGAVGLN